MTIATSRDRNKRDAVISRALLPWAVVAGLLVYALGFFMILAPVAGLVLPAGAAAGLLVAVFLCFMVLVGCFFARDTLLSIPPGVDVGCFLTKLSNWTEPSSATLHGPYVPPRALA
ncbi:hypothetical protein [Acidovorax temperans]|uniref:hypothetical protein n=1 Tax=Acidovorax temperans TaxID=80878 RepID=UPI002898DB03|nr:hypothetical protein [Acidovorax temperans]